MNSGKRFEQNFKNSVPADVLYYRFKDGTAAWGQDNTRFQCSNMCDCMLFDGELLLLVELKNHKGKSLPLSCIRESQLKEMHKAWQYKNVYPLLIVNFEELGKCYALTVFYLIYFIQAKERKSIPLEYFTEKGLEIPCKLKKINLQYDIGELFRRIRC